MLNTTWLVEGQVLTFCQTRQTATFWLIHPQQFDGNLAAPVEPLTLPTCALDQGRRVIQKPRFKSD